MRSSFSPLTLSLLALTACGTPPANNVQASANAAANGAAPAPAQNAIAATNASAAPAERLLRTETVSGTFTGWEMGDYLWAQIAVPGAEGISAQVGPSPVDLFLDANVGRPVTVEVQTLMANIPEAGGETEIKRISAARNAAGTAETWWQALSPADRAAAQRHFEQGALSAGGQ
jgi:hypothetical protein